jgi:hypothetical protein
MGYASGITTYTFGSPVDQYGGYSAQAPSGFAYNVEALYAPTDSLELGLGYFPIANNLSGTSTNNNGSGVQVSDTSTFTQYLSPILLTVYERHSIFDPRFHAIVGVGAGYVPASNGNSQGTQLQYDGGAYAYTNFLTVDNSYASGYAYQGVLGGEYSVSGWCSVFLFYQLLGAHFGKTGEFYNRTEADANGNIFYQNQDTTVYSANPPHYLLTQPVVVPVDNGTTTTTTTTYNDGAVQYTQTVVTQDGTGKQLYYQHIETDKNSAVASSAVEGNVMVGLTFRY